MNWKDNFNSRILDRGLGYYNGNRVKIIDKGNGGFLAAVRGSKWYNVFVNIENDRVTSMSCSCPYAKDGNKCKHMAAVMYAIDDRLAGKETASRSNPDDDVFVTEFPEEEFSSKNYSYFEMNEIIRGLRIKKKTYREAVSDIEQGKIRVKSFEYGFKSNLHGKMVTVQGYVNDGMDSLVEIQFSKNRMMYINCRCSGCNTNRYNYYWDEDGEQGCRHTTALLILANRHILENNIGDETDYEGSQILKFFKKDYSNFQSTTSELKTQTLTLVPRLEKKNGTLSLSFKIGTEKKFVVKNLSKLVDDVENSRVSTYGKSTEINHSLENFDESAKYIDFIKKCVKEEEYIEERIVDKYGYGVPTRSIGSSLVLYGNRIDAFYDLIGNDSVEYTDKDYSIRGKKCSLKCLDNNPKLSMDVSPNVDYDKGHFKGISVSCDMPEFFEGSNSLYYIDDKNLYRTDSSFRQKVLPFAKGQSWGNVEFNVGRNHLTDFYYDLLPKVVDFIDVEEHDSNTIRRYLKPQGEFYFYIDSGDDNVICKPLVEYGEDKYSILDSEKKYFRELDRETYITKTLENWFPVKDLDKGIMHSNWQENLIYDLLENGLEKLMELGQVMTTDDFRKLKVRRKANVSVGVSISNGLLDLDISTEDISRDELLDILGSYRQKKKFHRLRNGDFLNMDDSAIGAVDDLMADLGISDEELESGALEIPMYRALYLDKMLEDNEDIYANRDAHFRSMIKDFKTISESDFDEPQNLKKILRNYQKKGFKWLKTIESYGFGGILADDMGLGKTLQTITLLLSAKEAQEHMGPSIIISPAALVYNWGEEISRFAPELKVGMVTGNQSERRKVIESSNEYDVLVTSYDLVKRDIAIYKDINFVYEIIDEAQFIKNHKTAAAKAVKVINSRYRFALTGTPIENRLSELWSIFDYLMPGFLYDYSQFKNVFEAPIVKDQDDELIGRLQKMVAPFILRRLKGDVLKELPEKIEKVRFDRFEAEQQKLYDAQVVHMKNTLNAQDEGEFNKSKIQILAELTRLRQICCDPSLCFEDYKGGSAKREGCLELVESAIEGGHKILLFSQFTSMFELLKSDFNKAGISYYVITGATPKEKRLQLVNAFNEDDTNVFLISLKAGGTGLNLTGADVVIHYDPWWNLAVQNQATDRAHRIGQTKIVTEYKLIAKNTIEEKIQELQNKKRDLADQIINGEGSSLSSMSKDDLMELLGQI